MIQGKLRDLSGMFRSGYLDRGGFHSWMEREVLNGTIVNAQVMILDTPGCYWALHNGGCTMCGYVHNPHIPHMRPSQQFSEMIRDDAKYVKIFNSGSFFDDREIGREERERIYAIAKEKGVKKLLLETRPEFITPPVLNELSSRDIDITVAIGLESASDFVRINMINKGFLFSQYKKAVMGLRQYGIGVKTYLLLKPPFMSEREAYLDALASIEATMHLSDEISINPTNIQSGTLVNDMFRRGYYSPPWIWTLLRVMVDGIDMVHENGLHTRIMASPSGGGTRRGVHNCGRCDKRVLRMIDELSVDYYAGRTDVLDRAREMLEDGCSCLSLWQRDMKSTRYPFPDLREKRESFV